MKALIKSKEGFSLIEMVIAIALFTVISSGVLMAMVSSQHTSLKEYENKPKYEATVGKMDEMLDGDTSSTPGTDTSVNVQFPTGANVNVNSKVIRDNELGNVAIIKVK